MIQIDNSAFKFKIKNENNCNYIFDILRKSWLVLTPEEWVRQNFIQYITSTLSYPKSLIAIEKEIKVNEQRKRFDIVVYKNEKPWMLIECKQPNVQLVDDVWQQILAYNSFIQAQYLVVTNGNNTICYQVNGNSFLLCNNLPIFY